MLFRELQRHGLSLAENLAYNSEYSLLFLDQEVLDKLGHGVGQDRDVLFAAIVNATGTVVTAYRLAELPEHARNVQQRIAEILQPKTDGSYTPMFTERYGDAYYIFAPVFVPKENTQINEDAEAAVDSAAPRRELLGLAVVGISFQRVTVLLSDMQTQVLGLSLFIVLLAIVLAQFLVLTISHPIGKLADATRRIARGDLSQEVQIAMPGEIGELARAFNQMMQDVRSSRKELEQWAETLENRVSDRTREIAAKNQRLTELIAQMTRMQEQLVHSEKMASLGQLVAGIAHEINNPVNFISANITPLKQYISDLKRLIAKYDQLSALNAAYQAEIATVKAEIDLDFVQQDLDDLIRDVEAGAIRIKHIVQDLRNFSRLDEAECKTIDLHESLDTTLNLLGHIYENRISIHKQYGDVPLIECYAGQLNQVFMNILANAGQAIERKGNVWLTTAFAAGNVQIIIRDDGGGIPDDILPKIFDPFFTTKDVGAGTGLGLSISYGIIEKHHGQITVKSRVGEGTEFTITIPQRLAGVTHGKSQTAHSLR